MTARAQPSLVIPDAWRDLEIAGLAGVLMVIGAPDTGKSTFARWLFGQLRQRGRRTAFLDGDVGQSWLGPPTTLTLGLPDEVSRGAPPRGDSFDRRLHWFVGDVSPRGHMLPMVVGAGRLTQSALEDGAEVVVMDTTGLVDRTQGGAALKHALVDQVRPTVVFGFARGAELEPILGPLRRLYQPRVIELPVVSAVRQRDVETRQAHRSQAFARYFREAEVLRFSLRQRAVFDGDTFADRRLLALQDGAGLALALGLIVRFDKGDEELAVRTPLTTAQRVAGVRLGAIGFDLRAGREFRPGRKR